MGRPRVLTMLTRQARILHPANPVSVASDTYTLCILLHSPPRAAPGAGAGMSRTQITKFCVVVFGIMSQWNLRGSGIFGSKSFPQRHLLAHLQYFKVFTIAVPML